MTDIDLATRGRDYHNEIAKERDKLRKQLADLQEWADARASVLEELAITRAERDTLRADLEEAREQAELCCAGQDDLRKETDALRTEVERLTRERDAADLALQRISVALGGTSEWSDQNTMISYVCNLAESAERKLAVAVEALRTYLTTDTDFEPYCRRTLAALEKK